MEKLRTRRILEYLRKRKSCTLAELMAKFNVSSATIHRDVEELAPVSYTHLRAHET